MYAGISLSSEINHENYLGDVDFNYLEIGCYDGVNLAVLSEKFPSKKIFGIDPFISDGWTGQPKGDVLNTQKMNTMKNIEGKTTSNFLR